MLFICNHCSIDLYNSHKVVMNEKEPWKNHSTYKDKYASYKSQYDQQPIRDSKDSKYFVNKNHPQHNTWVQQQNNGKDNVRTIGNDKGNVRSTGNNIGNVRSTGNSIGKGNGNNKVPKGNNNQNKQDKGKGKGNDNGKGKDKK